LHILLQIFTRTTYHSVIVSNINYIHMLNYLDNVWWHSVLGISDPMWWVRQVHVWHYIVNRYLLIHRSIGSGGNGSMWKKSIPFRLLAIPRLRDQLSWSIRIYGTLYNCCRWL